MKRYRIYDGYAAKPLINGASEEACLALIASWPVITNVSERTTVGGEQVISFWWTDESDPLHENETHTRFIQVQEEVSI